MTIRYQGHKQRHEKAKSKWAEIIRLYENGVSAEQIAKIKNVTRQWVYRILAKSNKGQI